MTETAAEMARHGAPQTVWSGVRRVLAPNPSPMTFTGTASYIVGEDEVAIIDPGPDEPAHLAALLQAIGPRAHVAAILVTHSHRDHSALAPRLADATQAPVYAFGAHGAGMSAVMTALAASGAALGGGEGADSAFTPDRVLAPGEDVAGGDWRLRAVATPGHLSNHLAFALDGEGALFTGDAVMGWSTTLVSPPDGDMAAHMDTLRRLALRDDRCFLPGHGPRVDAPQTVLRSQIDHRAAREAAILTTLESGPATPAELVAAIYLELDPALRPAARRNVLAHLIALAGAGDVTCDGPITPDARFRPAR